MPGEGQSLLDSDGVTKATAPPINFRLTWPGEAASIHCATDGSTPTLASPKYEAQGPRRPGQIRSLDRPGMHDVKWIAVDLKGNVSPSDPAPGDRAGGNGRRHGVADAVAEPRRGVELRRVHARRRPRVHGLGDRERDLECRRRDLSVTDPNSDRTGHLVNGAFFLAQPLRANGSPLPATLMTSDGPVSNDQAAIEFKQSIARTEPLRTGSHSKTLTSTLSTTNP